MMPRELVAVGFSARGEHAKKLRGENLMNAKRENFSKQTKRGRTLGWSKQLPDE
jgi:hypothetical protein